MKPQRQLIIFEFYIFASKKKNLSNAFQICVELISGNASTCRGKLIKQRKSDHFVWISAKSYELCASEKELPSVKPRTVDLDMVFGMLF